MAIDEPNDLLVAYDDTPASKAAARFAAQRAEKSGETVDVVHIGRELTEEDIADAIDDAFSRRNVPVAYYTATAGGSEDENMDFRRKLTEIIKQGEYNVVYLGNEEYGLLQKLSKSSVSDALLDSHSVPVTLVPATEQ